jgi:hypothetical protein
MEDADNTNPRLPDPILLPGSERHQYEHTIRFTLDNGNRKAMHAAASGRETQA